MGSVKRIWVQIAASMISNSYLKGFFEGNIYRGELKNVCVPGLNCYSCPGAIGACPIGALQAVVSDVKYKFSFYIVGFLILTGTLFGRLICGYLCPFGFIQELLYKLPTSKYRPGQLVTKLKYVKYGILAVFVVLIPMLLRNDVGMGEPAFCKYICPAGTFEGGLPLLLLDESLRSAAGVLFMWKFFLLMLTGIAAILIYRSFCRFLCPLGAIYGLFNPISAYRFTWNGEKCVGCLACNNRCKIGIKVQQSPNDPECIRCGECIAVCPKQALRHSFKLIE